MSSLFQTEDWIDYAWKIDDGLIDQLWANYEGFVKDKWFWDEPCKLI